MFVRVHAFAGGGIRGPRPAAPAAQQIIFLSLLKERKNSDSFFS